MDVTKKLIAGSPGTRKLTEKYGAALVCVRYRIDRTTSTRFKTVELIVEEYPNSPQIRLTPKQRKVLSAGDVLLRIGYAEVDLRDRIKAAGGRWLLKEKMWRLPYASAVRLGVIARIVRRVE